jgi:hypothetical protein
MGYPVMTVSSAHIPTFMTEPAVRAKTLNCIPPSRDWPLLVEKTHKGG